MGDVRKYFPTTTGLAAQGEEWRAFRSLVQEDMMRPSSALYYIKDIQVRGCHVRRLTVVQEIAEEMADKVAARMGEDGVSYL